MTNIIYGPDIKIASLAEYVEHISKRPKNNAPESVKIEYLYRGHSAQTYDLCPSIAREKFSIGVESRLIEVAYNRLPITFKASDDKLTTLAKMQHYGIPTRLIDFTWNPLVALYFACQEKKDEKGNPQDGVVFEINNHIDIGGKRFSSFMNLIYNRTTNDNNNDEMLQMLSSGATHFNDSFIKDLHLFCIDNVPNYGVNLYAFIGLLDEEKWFKQWAAKNNFYKMSRDEKVFCIASLLKSPIIVEAQGVIERQRLQQGVYLITPNRVDRNNDGQFYIYKELQCLYHRNNNVGHYVIDAQDKEKILESLNRIGLNEGVLFSDSIDHVCAQIKKDICAANYG